MKSRKILILTALFLLLFMAESAAADETVIFASPHYPPLSINNNGVAEGILVEIIRQVCKDIDITPEFRFYPLKRCHYYMKNGEVDAVFPQYFSEERKLFMYYPEEPIQMLKSYIAVRKDNQRKIESLNDLIGERVGVCDKYSYSSAFDNFREIIRVSCTDEIEELRILNAERLDYIAIHNHAFMYYSKEIKFRDKFKIAYVIDEKPVYVAFSKTSLDKRGKSVMIRFSDSLKKMKKNGSLQN